MRALGTEAAVHSRHAWYHRHAESTPGLAQGSSILSRLIQTTLNGLSVDRGRLRTKAPAPDGQDVRLD